MLVLTVTLGNRQSTRVTVTVNSKNPDSTGTVDYSGKPVDVKRLKLAINGSYGLYQGINSEKTTPSDIYGCLMYLKRDFSTRVVKGVNLIKSRGVPEGTLS